MFRVCPLKPDAGNRRIKLPSDCSKLLADLSNDQNIITPFRDPKESPTMSQRNFCLGCGVLIAHNWWRIWQGRFCKECAPRFHQARSVRILIGTIVLLVLSFALGRHSRTLPPPLLIERAANSPLTDLPVNQGALAANQGIPQRTGDSDSFSVSRVADSSSMGSASDSEDAIYICGARTKKGTPCRRRVHFAGERCYQHKGRPSILPPDKLVSKAK